MTDNHGYNTPQDGATDWGAPLRENARNLDTDVEIRDTDANKSNYKPKDGAMYRATDTGAIYIGDGSAWVLADIDVDVASISKLGQNVDGQGNNLTNLGKLSSDELFSEHRQPRIIVGEDGSGNVVAYGPNGVIASKSDIGATLNSCVTWVGNNTTAGAECLILEDQYTISTEVVVPGASGSGYDGQTAIRFRGESPQTMIEMAGGVNLTAMFTFEIPETAYGAWHGLEKLELVGNKANNTSGIGVRTTNPSGHSGDLHSLLFRDLTVRHFQDQCGDFTVSNNDSGIHRFINTAWEFSNTHGLIVNQARPCYFFSVNCAQNSGDGMRGGKTFVMGGQFFKNSGHGFNAIDWDNELYGVLSNQNTNAGFYITNPSIRNIIRGRSLNNGTGLDFNDNANEFDGFIGGNTTSTSLVDGNSFNGVASESASAETPQAGYKFGTIVDFTDSGDGSGTGVYLKHFDGSWIQLA